MFDKSLSRRTFLAVSAMAAGLLPLDWKRIAAHADQIGPSSDYPTVIIGAGLGGLCCGAYLAKQKIPVTVVEQSDHPGGYACAFDRGGGKFRFDVSLHGTPINDNAAARVLEELGILKTLHLIELPEIYHLKTPDRTISLPQKDPAEYIRRLSEQFPAEKEGIHAFIRQIILIAEEVDRLHRNGMGPRILFPIRYPLLYETMPKTLAQLMNEYIKEPALQNILASLWDFHGLPPSKVSGLYYAAAKGDILKNGSYYVKHRSSDLSYALANSIQAAGGRIRYNCEVEKILVQKAAGIQVLSRQGTEADYRSCMKGDIGMMPFRCSVFDNIYNGYSRPGTSTLRILCLSAYEHWRRFEVDYRADRKKAYYEEKKKWSDTLVRRAEEIIPGLSSAIEIQEAATPLTNLRYTRNPEGAVYGFEQIVNNAYFDRMGSKTPIEGLYLASAWSSPGGGFSGVLVGGQLAFREMIADWSKRKSDEPLPSGGGK